MSKLHSLKLQVRSITVDKFLQYVATIQYLYVLNIHHK